MKFPRVLSAETYRKRIYGLDILRACAILFVVIGHGAILFPSKFRWIHVLFTLDGVSIFFVLSGYLIGGILLRHLATGQTRPRDLVRFWVRRWFRTLPTYFLILSVLLAFAHLLPADRRPSEALTYILFIQNFSTPHPGFFPEAWSLSVEEWFYVIVPPLLFITAGTFAKPKTAVPFVAAVIIVASTGYRIYRFNTLPLDSLLALDLEFRKQVLTRLDSLMFGVVCAYLQSTQVRLWSECRKPLLRLGVLILLLSKTLAGFQLIPPTGFYNCVLSFTTVSLATCLLLPYLSSVQTGHGMVYRVVTTASLISYSMYLIHLTLVQKLIVHRLPWEFISSDFSVVTLCKYIAYWLVSILLSLLLYSCFEKPATNLRDSKPVKRLMDRK